MKLGNVFKLSSGKSLPEKKRSPGNHNVYGGNGITGKHNDYFMEKPTIVIGRVGEYCGVVHLTTEKCWITDNALMVTEWYQEVDKQYLVYALNAMNLNQYAKTVGQPSISQANVYGLDIDLPLMEHQQEIVKILNMVSKIIIDRKEELKRLDDLIKARFVELFDTDEYPKVPISKLVVGKVQSVKKVFSPSDEIKYIDISSIDNKRNVMTGYTEYVLSEAPSRAQQHIKTGDIVISTVRPNLRNVAMTEFEDDNLVASSGFCVLRAAKCLPEYLLAIVCSDKFTDDMTKVVTGANYPAIKDSDVMNYQVAMPPMELQKEFAEFVHQVDKSKVRIQEALDEARKLRDSLMQQYFA